MRTSRTCLNRQVNHQLPQPKIELLGIARKQVGFQIILVLPCYELSQIWRLAVSGNNENTMKLSRISRGVIPNLFTRNVHLDAPSVIGTEPEKNSPEYQV